MAQSFWDSSKATYRNARGKEIPYAKVRQSVESVVDDTKLKLRNLTTSRNEGKITLQSWTTQAEPLLKKTFASVAQIGAGGKEQMTASLNGQLGAKVRFQMQHFKSFWLDVEAGKLSDAAILARMDMYSDAAVGVYESIRQSVMLAAGYTECLNILGSQNSCDECPTLTHWMPIEDMPPIGSRTCLSRCRCSLEYR